MDCIKVNVLTQVYLGDKGKGSQSFIFEANSDVLTYEPDLFEAYVKEKLNEMSTESLSYSYRSFEPVFREPIVVEGSKEEFRDYVTQNAVA